MKNIVTATLVALSVIPAVAAMTEHAYVAKIRGVQNCTMPADITAPGIGECRIELAHFKTGTEIVHRNGQCIQVVRELLGMEVQPTTNGLWVEVPSLHTDMTSVPCENKTDKEKK